jgi:N-acetylglutamate synthase-like GNAT family acetyltransferase
LDQGDWFYITDIWLEPSFRNKDLGAPLLGRLERSVSQAGRHQFYTWCASDHTTAFFQRQGYHPFCHLGSYVAPHTRQTGLRKFLVD